jgi:hypothetical protein
MTRTFLVPPLLGLLTSVVGCAPAPPPAASEPAATTSTTSGGEAEPSPTPIRTTVPVPVPQPAVAREALSEPLQAVWTRTEQTIAIAAPEPPAEATTDAVTEWSQGPFTEWLQRRAQASRELVQALDPVPEEPAYERAVAAGLVGLAYEDFVASARGAPIPEDISADPELLGIYVGALDAALEPVAIESVQLYSICASRIRELGDESPWTDWRAYCVDRGRAVIETYRLVPVGEPAGATEEPTG